MSGSAAFRAAPAGTGSLYLFKAREDAEGGVPAAGAVALCHTQVLPDTQAPSRPGTLDRRRAIDFAPDLAEEIGSARWFRELAVMLTLGIAALAFWPDFSALHAATSPLPTGAMRDEFRSQIITPLANGADSGRHMGPTARVVALASVPERASLQLTTTLAQGDSFGRMLQRAGVSAPDAARAGEMIAGAVPIAAVAPGTRFAVTLGRRDAPGAPRTLDKLAFRARFDLDLAVERRGGNLALVRHALAVDATPLRIRGAVGPSLFLSARAAGAPMKAIEQYLQTLAAHVSLEGEMAPSDQFDMIVGYKRSAAGENEVGDLLFAGLERDGKPRAQLLRWKDGRFVDAAAPTSGPGAAVLQGAQAIGMMMPVNGRMTSGYGLRRHPILGYARMHAGIDFGARWGSPIFAVSDGIVSFAGRHGGHGNYVRLAHGGGIGTGYGHMSRIAVSPGARVEAGQVIGYVGSTGLSTGPHLHYELYQNGRTVDPLSVRFTFRTAAAARAEAAPDEAQLGAFKARIAALKAVVPGAALHKFLPRPSPVKPELSPKD